MFKYFRQQLYVRLRNLEIAKSIDSSRTRLSEPLQGIFGTVLDSQQFARVYIPLRRRVTASISVLRVLVHSNPTTPIVSRLRKAVLSRIIRLHGIIAYTRRGQRTPAAPLHLFRPTVFWPGPIYGEIDTLDGSEWRVTGNLSDFHERHAVCLFEM